MFQRLRSRLHGEEGFTLIELLVVILIIGILAAIAIPSFLNQKGKASDATAKSDARTAQTAMETYATDHDGSYTTDATELHAIEPTIQAGTGNGEVAVTAPAADTNQTYVITAKNSDGTRSFTITGKDDGTTDRTCTVISGTNAGGCVVSGTVDAGSTGTW